MPANTYENNLLGLIPQEDWLSIPFNVRRQNDPTDTLFGDIRTDNIVAYWQSIAAQFQVPMMAQFHGYDTESQQTFRIPVDTHNIEKGLIKVKLNQSERMRALLRSGVPQTDMYQYVIEDGVRLADQVITRTKVAKSELLATGKVTIKENNLDLSVDYGVPADQKNISLDLGEDADIIGQIQDLTDKASEKGVTLSGLVTSKANVTRMRKNKSIQGAVNGALMQGQLVRKTAFEAFLEDEFGIGTVITNDLTYGVSATYGENMRPDVKLSRYFPENVLTFFAPASNGRLGDGLWGDPPETDVSNLLNVTGSGESPYVYITQWAEKDPAVLWTKASALFIPMLYNPESLWIAKAKPAKKA